ncbi:MAG: DUF4064 domain-containing protein [Nitrososphaerota archaeon]|nr:DUF4064 domain-containing protein [Nitrososphaerota archaeon]
MTEELAAAPGVTTAQPTNETPTAPFILSLIAGFLILSGVGMMTTFSYGTPYYGMMGGYYSMMNGYYGMMQGFGGGGWFYGAAAVGLIAGIVVLVGAIMIYARPNNASTWGLLVLIFSILSFFGMGGFFIGAILGIVGGVLAMVWKPGAAPK